MTIHKICIREEAKLEHNLINDQRDKADFESGNYIFIEFDYLFHF